MSKGVKHYMLQDIKIAIALLFAVMLLVNGCGNQVQESKSMEQIQTEEGIPVRVEQIKYQTFDKNISFYTQLEGIKEATKGAMIGGRIDRIKAKVGDNVVKDQVILEFAEDNPGLQYEQAKTAYENAEKTYKRMKALLDAGETAQANFDGAETNYLVSKRNFESLKQMLYIQSPFSGTIVEIKVNEGDNVKSEAPLFKVAQVNRMRAKVWANEDEITMLKKGMPAYTEIGGKRFTGSVTDISMAIDPMRRAFYAVVEFDNSGNVLKSGMTADIKILVYNNPRAIIVPRNIIMKDNQGIYVFVENDNIAAKRYITNGRDAGMNSEITSGLNNGEKIITQGITLVNDGSKVKVIN
jgi:membrane fusion protein, multidrug efflux system